MQPNLLRNGGVKAPEGGLYRKQFDLPIANIAQRRARSNAQGKSQGKRAAQRREDEQLFGTGWPHFEHAFLLFILQILGFTWVLGVSESLFGNVIHSSGLRSALGLPRC